jgi:hypothetical protein
MSKMFCIFTVYKQTKKTIMKITSNKQKRHFTIVLEGVKYRTLPLSKEEFEDFDNNTLADWKGYLDAGSNCSIII